MYSRLTETRDVQHTPHMTDRARYSMPPYRLALPDGGCEPFVVASPHSGRFYPPHFRRMSRLPLSALRRSEDCFVDRLAADAPAHGMPLLTAVYPRAYVDLNRGPDDLDPLLFDGGQERMRPDPLNERVASGLGVLARVVASDMPIYPAPLPFSEASRRLKAVYHPYHERLDALLDDALHEHGWCCLIDLHSMPSTMLAESYIESRLPDVVLGDRYGASCTSALTGLVEERFRAMNYSVVRNRPYAGGYCTMRHGRPASNRHAIQIEINRALYMDEDCLAVKPEFSEVARDIGCVLDSLSELDLSRPLRQAAE